MKNKRGQVTIFIIIAIVLIAGFAIFLTLRNTVTIDNLPASIAPVHTSFLSCIEEYSLVGIDILESQAGYIEVPDFEPGSSYMPFSNQLDFLGNPVPYWYYVSGNNIQKEQVPTINNIEEQLENYIEERIWDCNLESYYDEGFQINLGEPRAKVNIQDKKVQVELDMNLAIEIGEDSAIVKDHSVAVDSELGALYDSAKEIYNYEQDNLFLEEYGIDVLRLYAPVDGTELRCSPKIWNAEDVFSELREAIEANTGALKTNGKSDDYFNIDVSVPYDVRFLNSQNWVYSYEVNPSEDVALVAEPVGNQPGLGIIGFCYVTYHFVYDIKYPVLVQVYSGDEIFQFPLAVVIQGNKPREALDGSAVAVEVPELCIYKNTLVSVRTYDTNLNSIETEVSYECLGTTCNIGSTSGGTLNEDFPQCVNGYIRVSAEGYNDARVLYSTTEAGSVSLVLDKLYNTNIELNLENTIYNGNAIISFVSDDNVKTISYPNQKTVDLSEGNYEIQVQVYEDVSLKLAATTTEQCVEVPRSGLGGILGLTEEECFEIEFPEKLISNALAGGGNQDYYILESELLGFNTIEINAEKLPTPDSLEQLQDNYILFEEKNLDIRFK